MLPVDPGLGRRLLDRMRAAEIEIHSWWPPDVHTRNRRVYGAILVQQTAWTSAHGALQNLADAGVLESPDSLLALPIAELTEIVRSAGFHTRKPEYLRAAAQWLGAHGDQAAGLNGPDLFRSLTAVRGIGPESAHLIMLSCYGRSVFIADSYSRKLFTGVGLTNLPAGYLPLHAYASALCEGFTQQDFVDFHALKIQFGQEVAKRLRTYGELGD